MTSTTFEDMIADGRVRIRPFSTYAEPMVLNVSLDLLAAKLKTIITEVYLTCEPLKLRYSGSATAITAAVTTDVNALVDFSLLCCYNRLRTLAERYSLTVRTARCNPRAPVTARMEFPTWLSSLLSSIGPLRLSDGPVDKLVIYVPPTNTMNNYGRAEAQNPAEGSHSRLLGHLKAIGVATSPIDMTNVEGTVHPSHYTNDDVLRACVLDSNVTRNPFDPVVFTVGYVDDKTTLDALAAVAAPANLPANMTAASPGRPVAMHYGVNYHGIKPAVTATATTDASDRGCYIIGRGVQPIFTCYLAEHLTRFEVNSCLRTALLKGGGPAAA